MSELARGGHQKTEMEPDSDEQPPGGPSYGSIDEVVAPELLVVQEDLTGAMAEFFGTKRPTMHIELHAEGEALTPSRLDFIGTAVRC